MVHSCLTLCDPMDCSLPGSSVLGILQTRILGWVAIRSSRGTSQPWDWTHISCIAGVFFFFFFFYHFATGEVQKEYRKRLKSRHIHLKKILIEKVLIVWSGNGIYRVAGMCVLSHFSRVWLFMTPWTVARRAPLSMGFSRQELPE